MQNPGAGTRSVYVPILLHIYRIWYAIRSQSIERSTAHGNEFNWVSSALSFIEGVHIGACPKFDTVWQYLSPIPVGRRGVISSFKWFLPAVLTCRGKGEGSAPCAHGPFCCCYAKLSLLSSFLGLNPLPPKVGTTSSSFLLSCLYIRSLCFVCR